MRRSRGSGGGARSGPGDSEEAAAGAVAVLGRPTGQRAVVAVEQRVVVEDVAGVDRGENLVAAEDVGEPAALGLVRGLHVVGARRGLVVALVVAPRAVAALVAAVAPLPRVVARAVRPPHWTEADTDDCGRQHGLTDHRH